MPICKRASNPPKQIFTDEFAESFPYPPLYRTARKARRYLLERGQQNTGENLTGALNKFCWNVGNFHTSTVGNFHTSIAEFSGWENFDNRFDDKWKRYFLTEDARELMGSVIRDVVRDLETDWHPLGNSTYPPCRFVYWHGRLFLHSWGTYVIPVQQSSVELDGLLRLMVSSLSTQELMDLYVSVRCMDMEFNREFFIHRITDKFVALRHMFDKDSVEELVKTRWPYSGFVKRNH